MNATNAPKAWFAKVLAPLETGDFGYDFRAWIVSGVATVLALVGIALVLDDIRGGDYLMAATVAILPASMMVCWLLIYKQRIDAAADLLVIGLYVVIATSLVLTGGRAAGAYVAVAIILVVANVVTKPRFAMATNVACVLLPVAGLWLTTTLWHFPVAVDSHRFLWGMVRVSVAGCILIPACLVLLRRSSESYQAQLIEAESDAQEASEMLSSILGEHLSSMHLQARLQEIGRLSGWWFSPETRLVHHTVESAEVLSNFSLDDESSDKAIHGLSRPDLRALIAETIETRQPWDRDIKVTDSAGNTKWYHSLGEIEYENEEIKKIIGVLHDVSEVKEAQEHLARGQKLEAIGTLAAGIAHEINTPAQFVGDNLSFLKTGFDDMLALNQAYAKVFEAARGGIVAPEILKQAEAAIEAADPEYLNEEIPAAVNQSIDGVQRISHIVRAMKEFSHPGGGSSEVVDLNKLISNTITVATNEWKYAAELETNLEEDLPSVQCAAQEISQVVLNLIVNAAHAIVETLDGSSADRGKIRISTKSVDDAVEFSVSDSGCGIPDELRERVFEPFFTTKEVGRGTGQGLAMAHKTIVEKHCGSMQLESRVGEGSTFIVRLPVEAPQAALEEAVA